MDWIHLQQLPLPAAHSPGAATDTGTSPLGQGMPAEPCRRNSLHYLWQWNNQLLPSPRVNPLLPQELWFGHGKLLHPHRNILTAQLHHDHLQNTQARYISKNCPTQCWRWKTADAWERSPIRQSKIDSE